MQKNIGKMNSFKLGVLLLLSSSPFLVQVSSELKPLQGKVVSGLYYEESTKFIPYTKVVPMVFEFKLQSDFWRSSSNIQPINTFQILPRLNCRSDSPYPSLSTLDWYFTCPVSYHLHQYLEMVKGNYTDIYPIPPPPSPLSFSRYPSATTSLLGPQEFQKFSTPKVKFEDCDSVLDKMWKGVTNKDRDTGFAFYTGMVEKCSSMPLHLEEKIPDGSTDYTGYFDRMQSNFVSNFFLNSSDPGELVNNLLSLQSLQLQSIYAELTRVREATLACQNNLIPQSFLKYSRLEKALLDLRPKLLKIRYAMSTPSIQKLYRMPIADCVFGGNSLIIQVLLPVIRTDFTYTLLKVNSPIFLYANRLCKVHPGDTSNENGGMGKGNKIIADDDEPSKYYLYEKINKAVVSTTCTPGDTELCWIPDQSSRPPLISRCMTSVMNQSLNTEEIRYYCSLQCESRPLSDAFSKLIIPIIQRISTSKFVVAINRITTLLIKCEGKPDEMVTPQEYGAVEISLACGCYLMWHSEKFDARFPCGNSVMVRHVVPEHMLNRSAVNSKNKVFFVSNLGERINASLMKEDVQLDLFLERTTQPPTTTQFSSTEHNSFDYFDEAINDINNTNLVSTRGRNINANEFSFYTASSCYGSWSHTILWVAVAVETALFLGIALYLYCRIYEMGKRWDLRDRTTVTYSSAAQLTNMYD